MNKKYEYYFGPEAEVEHFHGDHTCPNLDRLCGDMTKSAALDAMNDDTDLDPCPECVDL